MPMHDVVGSAIALILGLSVNLCAAAPAQGFPSRPVRIVVPFAPGGSQDAVARSFNVEIGAALDQPFVVENKPGAGGVVGTVAVAKSPPDGYTLLLAGASHQINGFLYPKPPYRPLQDFTVISYIGSIDYVLVVPASEAAQSVAELIRHAKAEPGELNYASAGVGSAVHLAMAYFTSLAGIEMLHVPLKGGGDVLVELMAGRAHASIVPINVALPYAMSSRVRLLAVSGAKRSKFLPDLPTIAESGVRRYTFQSWLGLLGPAGLPHDVVERIDAQRAILLSNSTILERLGRQGVEPGTLTSAQFADKLKAEEPNWADVVRRSGAKLE